MDLVVPAGGPNSVFWPGWAPVAIASPDANAMFHVKRGRNGGRGSMGMELLQGRTLVRRWSTGRLACGRFIHRAAWLHFRIDWATEQGLSLNEGLRMIRLAFALTSVTQCPAGRQQNLLVRRPSRLPRTDRWTPKSGRMARPSASGARHRSRAVLARTPPGLVGALLALTHNWPFQRSCTSRRLALPRFIPFPQSCMVSICQSQQGVFRECLHSNNS